VAEADFNSYYPYTIIINKGNKYPIQLVKLFTNIYNARLYYKNIG